MKIAFFGDTDYVGTREWIAFLACQEGVEIHAIVFSGERGEIPGARFHTLPGWLPRGKLRYLLCVPSLRAALASLAPDLMIAYRVVSYGFAAALTGFHPLVLAAQGQFIVSRETPRFFRFFARRAVCTADLVHSWAPPMTESLVRLGARPDRILTLTRGVDESRFPFREEPPPPLTLVTTRQLEPYYNFPTLLEAVERVRAEIGDVRYLIAGEGSARGELEEMARRRRLSDVVSFLGTVPRERLPELLRSAHVYISAVPSDGTSASLLEAMASGTTPVVADNEANRFWITDGEGGWLVPAADPAAFARAIVECWRSREWRRRAREANRKVIESQASWRRNMGRFVEAYAELLTPRSAGRDGERGGPRDAL